MAQGNHLSPGNVANLRPWRKGQSGNPGGVPAHVRAMHLEAGERAARLRLQILASVQERIDAIEDRNERNVALAKLVHSDFIKLMNVAEDRAYGPTGKPHQGNLSGEAAPQFSATGLSTRTIEELLDAKHRLEEHLAIEMDDDSAA